MGVAKLVCKFTSANSNAQMDANSNNFTRISLTYIL